MLFSGLLVNKKFCLTREIDKVTQRVKACLSFQCALEENKSISVQYSWRVKISFTLFLCPQGR